MNEDLQRIFRTIHESNAWLSTETASGLGSEKRHTSTLLVELQQLVEKLEAHSFLDIPCGDHHWIQPLDVDCYIGADILPELIARNRAIHGKDFRVLDITTDPLPTVDVVFSRDLFGHLSDANILRALDNVRNSGSTWLACTTFTSRVNEQRDADAGWRPLNLMAAPFYLKPIWLFNERCTEGDGRYDDKCIGVFEVRQLTCGRIGR